MLYDSAKPWKQKDKQDIHSTLGSFYQKDCTLEKAFYKKSKLDLKGQVDVIKVWGDLEWVGAF